jgi:hypothetical protein
MYGMTCILIYMYMYIYIHIYVCIYNCRDSKREKEIWQILTNYINEKYTHTQY